MLKITLNRPMQSHENHRGGRSTTTGLDSKDFVLGFLHSPEKADNCRSQALRYMSRSEAA